MRIYFYLQPNDTKTEEKLCEFWCQNDNIDLCDVQALPILGDLRKLQPIGESTAVFLYYYLLRDGSEIFGMP